MKRRCASTRSAPWCAVMVEANIGTPRKRKLGIQGYTTLPQLPPRPPPTHATPPLHDRCYRGRATFATALAPCVSDHASPSDGSFASARQRPPRPLGEGAPVHDHLQHDFGIVLSPRGMHDGERGARTPIPTKRAPRHDERALEGRTGVRPAGGAPFLRPCCVLE